MEKVAEGRMRLFLSRGWVPGLAADAVLIAAVTAVVIGVMVFAPHVAAMLRAA
jgi:hypothetical protein